jgi:RHS repeat-associated protein
VTNSNVLTRKTRANQTITFTYDTLNRLATKAPPSPAPVVTYSYDLLGRLKSASDAGAAIPAALPPSGSSVQYATNYTYDTLNRITRVSFDPTPAVTPPMSGTAVTFGHTYNRANQRSGQTTTDNSWWSYPVATPSTVSYTPDALNRYTAVGAVTPSYDGNGNLTGDGTFTLGYDAENRLVSASGGGNTASYAYDAQGRRKSKTVNGATTVFVTDADNREVLEYDGSNGQVLRWYAYGLGPNDVLGQINLPAGTRATFIPDLLGSIVGTLDSAGTLTKIGYMPYGAPSNSAGPFRFTGQHIDPETGGLHYYRARMYSAAWGRFLQTDPIGYTGGINLYVYVGNDPLNLFDPLGLAQAPSGSSWGSYALLAVHAGLDVGTIVPVPLLGTALQLINAGIYQLEGDPIGVGASVATAALAAGGAGAIGVAGRTAVTASAAVTRNFATYEVLSEQAITGTSRTAQRASANQSLYGQLTSDPAFANAMNQQLGANVTAHMASGRSGLLNPPGTVWHHPANNPSVLQLMRSGEHSNPMLQQILHPSGVGGYGRYYGN